MNKENEKTNKKIFRGLELKIKKSSIRVWETWFTAIHWALCCSTSHVFKPQPSACPSSILHFSDRQRRLTHSFQGKRRCADVTLIDRVVQHTQRGRRQTSDASPCGWQKCEVMSACDEVVMWAHLACDVSTAIPYFWKWEETWKYSLWCKYPANVFIHYTCWGLAIILIKPQWETLWKAWI